jgi:hypothetical protein
VSLTREALRLRFWWAIAEHAPDAWRELARGGAPELAGWLKRHELDRDRWCRELAERQLNLWATLEEARDARAPTAFRQEPRLPEEERTFRLEVEGWRPDRTMGETLARLGLVWDADADGNGWGETWREAETRIRRAFESALAKHRRHVEARLAELRSPIRKTAIDRHLALLVRYQVLGVSYHALAGANRAAVRQAVEDTAARLGLTLRAPSRPGRPLEKGRKPTA